MTSRTGDAGARPSRWWGAACGLLAAAAAMGTGQLLAGFTVPAASPVVVVGQAAIDRTPLAVKDWATSTFGTGDKTVLLGGVLVVVLLYSAGVGVLAVRRFTVGLLGLAIFAGIGLAAAMTRHGASGSYAVPTVSGALAGALALRWLVVTARGAALAAAQARAVRAAFRADQSPVAGFGPRGRDGGVPAAAAGPAADDGRPDRAGQGASQDAARRREGTGWMAATSAAPASPEDEDAPSRGASGGGAPWERETGPFPAVPAVRRPVTTVPDASPARRQFLFAAGASVAVAAVGTAGGRSLATRKNVSMARQALKFPRAAEPAAPLPPGVNLPVPGISPFITPNNQFYRVDTAILVPQVDPSNWQLRIHGMVAREVTVTFDELLRRPLIEDYLTLCCVSNPVGGPYIGNAKWLGASLAALLREARPQRGADQLLATSSDGFTSGTPLTAVLDGRDALVAVAMNGAALPTAHGFPARLVVPGLYGYVSACKWVVDLEVTTFAAAQGYWVPRGWSQLGPVKTESRIDVPAGGSSVKAGKVAVAGVAWAQHKGIEAVEARVDRGAWHQATLAAVPGIDTWRQWVWEWDATPGSHLIEARATDKTGYTQTSAIADVAPNGATGYPSAQVTVS
jgi:DMSO/TMAO reductase YedYZ molybdopterin-dependent catalytic subunit